MILLFFFKELNLNESFKAQVVDIIYYDSFSKLIDDYDISLLADSSITKDELKKKLEEFYTKEEQEKYGVIGIKLRINEINS